MSYRIDPNRYCVADGCTRPKATGEEVCSPCSRLARATGAEVGSTGARNSAAGLRERAPDFKVGLAGEPGLPRCVAYLSLTRDVITLELTGEPRFTEEDVQAIAAALSNRRKAA